MNSKKNFLLISFFLIASIVNCVIIVNAAEAKRPDYATEKYSKIDAITLAPGESKKIKIGFYNRGIYNWHNTGKNYISLYTYKPKYHPSTFKDKTWLKSDQPTKIKDSLIGPNNLGYFEFNLQAPKKPGVYKENFALAAENKTWIAGGQFELTITVASTTLEVLPNDTATVEAQTTTLDNSTDNMITPVETKTLTATRLSRVDQLILKPQEQTTISIMFLNKSDEKWIDRKLILDSISPIVSATGTSFNPGTWLDEQTVLENNQDEILPGRTEIYAIPLKTPGSPGIYTLHFILKVDNQPVEGGNLDLPITIAEDNFNVSRTATIVLPNPPQIRVGLFTTEEPLTVAVSDNYNLQDSGGQNITKVGIIDQISLWRDEKSNLYKAKINNQEFSSTLPLRLVPQNNDANFTITNYTRNPLWTNKINYNQFRGALEVRLSKTNYLWAINELSLEDYLKGLGEESDSSPSEFLKALITAARSYAYEQILNPTRHTAGSFILDADYDQVYRGLIREEDSPNTVAAAEETRGMAVTYAGRVITTPYFGQSNGKTRDGGEPWLKPVSAKYDRGLKFWGHGVGMSSRDANIRAKKENATWDTILKHYYTGIELQKMY